ncbi:ferredoxin [Lacticaseibacillus nasuensis]|uniref:ferredoxin n=1 Tax=Lacticaseibacillus nasuensis TaxID=944671 RepID=UPI0022478F38|nr:ferredoxin [Lacticaseibacillus nasuensis]MCX2455588.1 ferredoxin [Lacticaseibacillus nasuensis]
MTLYAKVQQDACIACGLCQLAAPSLFSYDANGIASYAPDHNTGSQPVADVAQVAFKLAYTRCPTHAIKRSNQPFPAPPPPRRPEL